MTASGVEFIKYVAMEAFPSGKRSLSIPFCHGKSCMLNPWSRFVLYLNMLSLELSQNTERFPWNGESEDMFFCHAAADIFDELPRSIQPAPMTEENEFSKTFCAAPVLASPACQYPAWCSRNARKLP
jgi:hypothetical protein